MKFLILSDIHGNPENLEKLDAQIKESDGIIFAGDFTRIGEPETGIQALEALCKKSETIFSVTGNCDAPDFIEEIEKRDISVQKTLVNYEGLMFTGCGGGTPFDGSTPNEREEDEILTDLNIILQDESEWDNLVTVMHNPPFETKCDTITSGIHVGSKKLREYIETVKPLMVVTGHIHESKGIDTIGETTIINPGALFEGNYAVAEISKVQGKWKVVKAELKSIT